MGTNFMRGLLHVPGSFASESAWRAPRAAKKCSRAAMSHLAQMKCPHHTASHLCGGAAALAKCGAQSATVRG